MDAITRHPFPHRLRPRHSIFVLLSLISVTSVRDALSFQSGAQSTIANRVTVGALSRTISTMPSTSRSRRSSSSASSSSALSATTQFVTNKRCPFAQKAWIALEASDCPFEMREVSLYGSGGKPDWFWELNPQGTVPVVAVKNGGGGQEVFADSELILDAVGDGRVGGADREDGVLLFSGLSEDENSKAAEWRKLVSKQLVPVGKSAVLGGSLPKLRSLLEELDKKVVGHYLVGDKMTVADCCAFPFLWRIDQEFGIGGNNNDGEMNLRAWLDKCMTNESIKRTIPAQGWWWWW